MKFLTLAFRMTLTAYCFAQFAIQVLWLGKQVMPQIMRYQGQVSEKRKHALFHAHKHVVIYLNTLTRLGLVSFRFVGTPINEPSVIVANHPSLLDFIVLLKDFPNAVCLYKSKTRDNPILSNFVKVAGYIEGMDGTREASKRIINECCQRLDEGHHVIVFAEGTRSRSSVSIGRFHTTSFLAAFKSNCVVQPVVIYCDPLFLGKKQSWTEFSRGRNRMVIEYQEPIRVAELPKELRSTKGLVDHTRATIKKTPAGIKRRRK